MPITLPYTFTNGQIADAAQVNANFSALAQGAGERIVTLQSIQDTPVIGSPSAAAGSDPFTITSLNLTAGDWDVRGVIWFGITLSAAVAWTGKFSTYFDTVPNGWGDNTANDDWNAVIYVNHPSNPLTYPALGVPTHIRRLRLTSPRMYYLTGYIWVRRNDTNANICTALSGYGIFTARRVGDI